MDGCALSPFLQIFLALEELCLFVYTASILRHLMNFNFHGTIWNQMDPNSSKWILTDSNGSKQIIPPKRQPHKANSRRVIKR